MIWIIIGGIVWIICGVLAYAINFAFCQGNWPSIAEELYRQDMGLSVLAGLFGPIGLAITFLMSGFAEYGLKWR